MPPLKKMAFKDLVFPWAGTLAFVGVLLSWHQARTQSAPPPLIRDEMRQARTDFAQGGIRALSASWYSCIDRARDSQDANAAERCVVYGYSALLLGDASGAAARTPWMRHLTADIVAPGQIEMLSIMGIPEGPRQAWLDRYRRWVSDEYAPDASDPAAGDGETAEGGMPRRARPRGGDVYGGGPDDPAVQGRAPYGANRYGDPRSGDPWSGDPRSGDPRYGDPQSRGAPFDTAANDPVQRRGASEDGRSYPGPGYGVAPPGRQPRLTGGVFDPAIASGGTSHAATETDAPGRGTRAGPTDLAQATVGKYPREALREPNIAEAIRQRFGPVVFDHLQDYDFGSPMEFTGRYTVGTACEPRACGVSEARFVFSADDVWIGIVDGRRLRIFGDPPRQVRAFLLRDRNQVAWRGVVVDMTQATPPQVIPASLDPTPGGPPRLSIAPRPFLSPEPEPRAAMESGTTEIRLRDRDGTLEVPVTINGAVTMPFAIDSGASDVSVSSDVMRKLIQAGTVSRSDYLGKQVYHLADGSAVSSETFRIHVLKVGDREVRDVTASIADDADSLLLGQSFLKRFRSWSIDNQRQVLLLK